MNPKMKTLRKKAMSLPLTPGVYIMKNKKGEIIYIGKAKKLKNRVSQYFGSQNNHTVKVMKMVENVDDFDVILTDTEFECLVLECSLIKQHAPKYNILLKDDKGYSYIKITKGEYPKISFTYRRDDDNAEYLGPYTSSFTAKQSVDEALKIFRLPQCSKEFPRDVRSVRPCLNFYINQCMGVCNGKVKKADYLEAVNSAIDFLKGDSRVILENLQNDMEKAAENLDFEKAAKLRDRINAIKKLKQKQKVYSNVIEEQDVFALAEDSKNICLMILRFKDGRLFDSTDYIIDNDLVPHETLRNNLVLSYYSSGRVDIPKRIALDGDIEDKELLEEYLTEKRKKKVEITVPQRSEQLAIVKLCYENAAERLAQYSGKVGKNVAVLDELKDALNLKKPPEYIESYDISHTAGADNVGGMIVFKDGKPYKNGYRKFTIKSFTGQDDYASMNEVLTRRFNEYLKNKDTENTFGILPDLILLDGGIGQVNAVRPVLEQFGLDIPLFGMVKDSKHRTRAIAYDGGEIAINSNRRVFSLITEIQDEVHRYAISFHHQKHKKSAFSSRLTEIDGIGEKKAKALMKHFKTVAAIKSATVEQLKEVGTISQSNANAIYNYFNNGENK